MRRIFKLSVPFALAALAAGCPKSSAPLPEITSFTATPATLSAGQSATLAWTVANASQVSIDPGGVQQGNSLVVTPAVTTTYHLTATGLGGDATADAVVTVTAAVPKPVITAFSASPSDIPSGSTSTLTWKVTGTVTKLTLSDGSSAAPLDVTGTLSKPVAPDTVTTYTLTASNSGGSSSLTTQVSVHSPSLRLQYTDPSSATAKILVVKNAASTPSRLVLDVKVGALPVTAFGFAMNIPLARTIPADPSTQGPFAVDPAAPANPPGLIANGAIHIGASPATGAVLVGGPAMPTFISVGVAKHKSSVADGDDTWAPGATLFSIALKLVGSPATGDVFIGSTVAADPTFKAAALRKDGTEAVSKADIALGDFIVSL